MEKSITIVEWSSIMGEANATLIEDEINLSMESTDEEIIAYLRSRSDDEPDPDMPWGIDYKGEQNIWSWRADSISRSKNTITVEWRSDRNHLEVSMVIFD